MLLANALPTRSETNKKNTIIIPAVINPFGVSTPSPPMQNRDHKPKIPRTKKNITPCAPPRNFVGKSSVDHNA